MNKNINEEELLRGKKNIKKLRTIMIIFDVLALSLLIVQIMIKEVSYYSYIILIICNIIAFTAKIESNNKKSSG